jgi:hypothetical protein
VQHFGGTRQCPNPDFRTIVFVLLSEKGLVESFPPEVIDFDATNLPAALLVTTLEEAIRCHATKSYRAAALMVRRLVEELCDDKGAGKGDLKARLATLGQTAVIPKQLLDAADGLRLLGNDVS